MGEIRMTRVDARLIHGQGSAWIRTLDARRVVIIDDGVANDDFMIDLLETVAPSGVEVLCLGCEQAVEQWKQDEFGDGRVMVLFERLDVAKEAYAMGFEFEELNIGQVPGGEGRRLAVQTVSLSMDELEQLEWLEQQGVRVYFQALPPDKQTPLQDISAKFRSGEAEKPKKRGLFEKR